MAIPLMVAATACSQSATIISDTTVTGQEIPGVELERAATDDSPADDAPATTVPAAETPAAESPVEVTEPPDAMAGPDLQARGAAVVESLDVLPAAYSTIAAVGTTGYFYRAIDGQMALVAFDDETLAPLYQVAASPLGRIRGVGQEVLVDAALGLVFVTGYDVEIGGEQGGYLAAHDAATGNELWRTSIDFWASQPFDCGDVLCVRSIGEQRSIDKASGSLMQFVRVSDRRVLHSSDALTVTTQVSLRTDSFAGLIGSFDFGFDTAWEVTESQLASAVGSAVDPSFGWEAEHYLDDGVVIAHLARVDGEGWGSVAIDSRSGNILWARSDLAPCMYSPLEIVPPIVCTTGDEPFVSIAIERINPQTGDTVWAYDLPDGASEIIYDGTKLIAWRFGDAEGDDGSKVELDPETGDELPAARAALCLFLNPWHDFEYPDGDVLDFASGATFSMCSSDAYLLYPDEVILTGPTTGLATDAPTWLVDFDGIPIVSVGGTN